MAAPASLIPELEEVIQHGSPERRADALKRITAFFLDGGEPFNEDHVRLFDDVFGRLIAEIETKARAELAHRLAPVGNAPVDVVRRLAKDDDIAVAGPVLEQSPRLAEADLVDIAKTKSQAHLLAISGRTGIAEPVTDVLVRRGDREVVRTRCGQPRMRGCPSDGFSTLVDQAEEDGMLAEKVGLASRHSAAAVPRSAAQGDRGGSAAPGRRRQARDAGGNPARAGEGLARGRRQAAARDYSAAQRAIEALHQEGKLNEAALVDFAKTGKYEETVAALACLCVVPIDVVDRLMGGDRPDPILILCKSAGWGWPTVKTIIMARSAGRARLEPGLDTAYHQFRTAVAGDRAARDAVLAGPRPDDR